MRKTSKKLALYIQGKMDWNERK
jgi:RNA polymerase sigma factor (sigma-70 family)